MRGKVFVGCQIFFLSRITPAYAGKRKFRRLFLDEFRDHPRLCGEKGGFHFFAVDRQGITPAYAGKRSCFFSCSRSSKDHPRLCGEKIIQTAYDIFV